MMNAPKILLATVALAALTACGGGSSSGSPMDNATARPSTNTGTKTPTTTTNTNTTTNTGAGPDSDRVAELLGFVRSSESNRAVLDNDVVRLSRGFDGGSVAFTSVAGTDSGVIRFREDGQTKYILNGKGTTQPTSGTAIYTGPMTVDYRAPGENRERYADGDMGVSVDFGNHEFSAGGIVSNARNTIEVFSDGDVRNGNIDSTGTTVRLRDSNGNIVRDYDGSMNGILKHGDNGRRALMGTVNGSGRDGFRLKGGFVVNDK